MLPVGTDKSYRYKAVVTYTISALCVLIYLWDRQWHILGQSTTFGDLTMRPSQIVESLHGHGFFPLVTLFTSTYLHGGLVHIGGNLLFLIVFGPAVEYALGPFRFGLYYTFWGLIAGLTQVFVTPHSVIPTLGASGAIGGVLGAYFLLFPSSKVEILVPLLAFLSFQVRAWILLGIWFLLQILFPQDGVANWAHAGGFTAGMVTVLILGGRKAIFKGRELEMEFIKGTSA